MHASTAERLTGLIELRVRLAGNDEAAAEPVMRRVSTWARAIEIGCFGPGLVRVEAIQAQSGEVRVELLCERLIAGAVHGLARLLQHLSATQVRLGNIEFRHNGRLLATTGEVSLPDVPSSLPFVVEYPEDLTSFVRVEVEFRTALTLSDREAIFNALAVWDVLIAAFGDQERWSDWVDLETRLLNPRIVEHQVDGFFASFECLHMIVLLCLRVHQRQAIERITLE